MATIHKTQRFGGRLSDRVSEEVRALMARHRKTQSDVAGALGIQQPQVSARLHGRVAWGVDEVGVLADMFGVTPGELVEGVRPRPFPHPPAPTMKRARRYSKPQPSDPKVAVLGAAA